MNYKMGLHSSGHNLWLFTPGPRQMLWLCIQYILKKTTSASIINPKYTAPQQMHWLYLQNILHLSGCFDHTSQIYCTSTQVLIIIKNILNKATGALIIYPKYTASQQIRYIQIYCTRQQVQFALLVEFAIYEILHLLLAINNLCALILKQTFVKSLSNFSVNVTNNQCFAMQCCCHFCIGLNLIRHSFNNAWESKLLFKKQLAQNWETSPPWYPVFLPGL